MLFPIFFALTVTVARSAPLAFDRQIQRPRANSIIDLTPTTAAPSASPSESASSTSSDFHLQNGLDAQKLNAQFKELTTSSECTDGDQACVNGSFAQCAGGTFILTPCSSGTICAALPLVNKPGTSIACDTASDVAARIAATGATGDVNGAASSTTPSSDDDDCSSEGDDSDSDNDDTNSNDNSNSDDNDTNSDSSSDPEDCDDDAESSESSATVPAQSTATTAPASSDFKIQNGIDAQNLNAKFKSLTSDSQCTDGEQACIGTSFAQCVSGSFVLTPCSGGLICAALPLVNSPGTSIACDASDDVQARITASGAAGGITGA
ncbi:hypothetical protein R3P38DRAFT_1586593 [Favolaschia claudopus]|uniref:Carbohydrate-binding module family 19 domain-containing protein n=1 Tax=Favolaschia claudopus TaxID=2862362 RepID=A0AAW0AGV5_9AGAR